MEQVRVTSPHESENQCGVWHLPLPAGPGATSAPMVTVRVYLDEAERLGFDLDSLAVPAAEASDLFHQAGVRGPRLLYDSESSPMALDFKTRVTIHEHIAGDEVLPDEGWDRTTEDVFLELSRLHGLSSTPHTKHLWDRKQERRVLALEHGDFDHRLDTLIGGVPLFVLWQPTLVNEGSELMGFTHGNPIRRKMRRGADGRIGFTDSKLAQYAPIAWDWARYYLVNDWADDAERRAVHSEIRTILQYLYGDGVGDELVADFERYVQLEARKSIIGDAYRLPKKIATGFATIEEVLPDFYRNVALVRRAAGQDPISEEAVHDLLAEWALRELELLDTSAAATTAWEIPPARATEPRRWMRRMLHTADRELGAGHHDVDKSAALAAVQRWDGPRRLEPVRLRWLGSPEGFLTAVVTAAVVEGTRISGEVYFTFVTDASGRMVADCVGDLEAQKVEPLVLDFVRDAGADRLRAALVSDWAAAARAGFDLNREHPGEREAIREALCDAIDDLEQRVPTVPPGVAEIGRRLRAGDLPTLRELWDAGLVDAGVPLEEILAPWAACIDMADAPTAADIEWSQPKARPVVAIPTDPPAQETLLDNIKREGRGTLDSKVAARQILRARLRAPDYEGNNKRTWRYRDDNGNRIVVHQVLPTTTGEKDLTRNPDPSHRNVRWFHWLPFDAPDAVQLAGTVTDVPARVYRWRDYYVEEYADGRTPEPDDPNWDLILNKMFEAKRRLLDMRLPPHLQVRPVTEHLHLYLDQQRRNYRRRAPWLDRLFRLAPHQAWSPDTDDAIWRPSLNHNDMTLSNLRIDDENDTATLIDWDNAAVTHPLWDYVTMLWSNWPPEIAEQVENKIRTEVRDLEANGLVGPGAEAELDRLLTMGCLDSLYADSRNFVQQIAEDAGKADRLTGRFYSDYRRLCRLRGWEPESPNVVRTLMLEAVNEVCARQGLPTLPNEPAAQPIRQAPSSAERPEAVAPTARPHPALPAAEVAGDTELLAVVNGLLDRRYGPRDYAVTPTAARYTDNAGNRCLTVSATIVAGGTWRVGESGDMRFHVSQGGAAEGLPGVDEAGDMRFHVRRDENGRVTVTFDHLVVDPAFAGGHFAQHFVPQLRQCVGTDGRVIVPVNGPTGFTIAAQHGLRLDSDPDHLAESRESTAHLLSTDPRELIADPMLDRFDRPAEARPTFTELAAYLEPSSQQWPQDRRWWGVLDSASTDVSDPLPGAAPRPTARMASIGAETEDPALTGTDIELLTTLFRNRAHFAGNHHGVWIFELNGRKVVIRASINTPNPNFDPRIGLTFGESAAVQLCRKAGVRVPALYHVGAQESYPEHYLFHEYLDGEHPTPDDPWQDVAETVFPALDRLHALHAEHWAEAEPEQQVPTTRVEWEQRLVREVARIPLEFDTDDRLHGELGLPGLYEIFAVRPATNDDIQLGVLHGDPTFLNMKLGPDGAGLLDLELTQPGSPVWDYVAFATRNPWPTPTVRNKVMNWCRARLRRDHGADAAADFDRYLVLEAWKSVAGDSFRLPLLIARDPSFLADATDALHRNLKVVFAAAGRRAPDEIQVRSLLQRWSRQFVRQRENHLTASDSATDRSAAVEPVTQATDPDTSWLPRLSVRELLMRATIGHDRAAAEAGLSEAIATLRCADGPARLEALAAEYESLDDADPGVVSRIRLRTVLMDGTREYGEITVRFDLDEYGRVTARPEPIGADLDRLAADYGGPYLLGPAEDLARRMGADAIEVEVSRKDGVRAARCGYSWVAEPGGQAGPSAWFARRWAYKDLTDPALPTTPITFRPALRRPQGTDYLLDIAEPVHDGGLQLDDAARMLITVVTNSPDVAGHYTEVWCVTDGSGKPVKVRRIVATPGDKDLAANPTHPKLLAGDRLVDQVALDDERAEGLARQAGVDVPTTMAHSDDYSFREMGPGRVPTTGDPDWPRTLRALLRQLRRLQAVELPDDLSVRTVADQEQLYLSMQRIKQEQSHPFLHSMRVPLPHEIWVPGDTTWTAGLSHGNATFRNLWVRPDGEVRLDNWNLTGVRHRLWDYVTVFWNSWPPEALARVTIMVEDEIRDQHGESGVREFQRLRAMAALDSLYTDSRYFVRKISIDPATAGPLTRRFYSDYLALWSYAETTGQWPSRGTRLTYQQVRDLMLHAADPSRPRPDLPSTGLDTTTHSTRRTTVAPDPNLSEVPAIPDLLAEPPAESELLPRLSGLQREYGLELELRLTRVNYLRTDDESISGIRIRGVFVSRGENPAEAGDLDLSIEFDENGWLTARFDKLWIEPWQAHTRAGDQVVSPLRAYLRRSEVEDVTFTVHGRRGARAAIRHDLDWNGVTDPDHLAAGMRALSSRIRADLALEADAVITRELRQLLDELDNPPNDASPNDRYPTLAEIDRHLPRGMHAADFLKGFHWIGHTTP
ncbi:phosphotransferase family protein [Nocardia sp. SC052]|uniref:phosphotransferase family protein n=1 Tax=Nocardia sichangensis TaxID=3385975 RepID=UPI0039A116A6